MAKIIVTKGLPGSGKSTWAKSLVAANPGQYKRVNKDDLRALLDMGKFSKKNEAMVLGVRDFIVEQALKTGVSVIVDDTNLEPKHVAAMENIAARYAGVKVEVKDFTDVPLAVCLERNLIRPNSVDPKVIRKMHDRYLREVPVKVEYLPGLPEAVICDIDGTLAQHHRSPYAYDLLSTDTIIEPVRSAFNRIAPVGTVQRIIMSGRPDTYKGPTIDWLMDNHVEWDNIYMRAADDYREDSIVKEELYMQKVNGRYNVLCVLDDRDRVVDMWRRLGLTCFQVADGDF